MRRQGFSYADAATLLGGRDSAVVRALDTALGGVLLAATAGTSQLAISLFDARSELTKLSERMVGALAERRHDLGRVDRTDRLAAAHTVLVITGFFEAVRAADLPFRAADLRFDRTTETGVVAGAGERFTSLGQFAHWVCTRAGVPPLAPATTTAELRDALAEHYQTFAVRLGTLLQGLAGWDALTETEQQRVLEFFDRHLAARAVARWEVLFRRLAGEFPELGFYVDRADHEATRRRVSTGLAAIEERLDALAATSGDLTRAALARRYQAELGRAIVDAGDVPDYLELPTLREGYVDPDYRAAAAGAKDAVHLEQFWNEHEARDDLAAFLVAHLSSLAATARPMLLLGQPGAGKSVLTKFLAGRLPESEFVVVRVVLRQTPADADVQTQIEDAVRQATGEQLGWPAVSRAAGNALRVVILDGFDELLQATGVGQSTYLREVAAFQEREADQDRPVAVIVTSRVSVADRALMPAAGATVVRLEPFREEHVARWLKIWNDRNEVRLRARGLFPLFPAAALAHRDLAEQPLLLLMLALYDADDNALQRGSEVLSTPDLYEGLLERFARREIAKNRRGLADDEVSAEVRDELHRLSITAMSMFHRGQQWVTQADLDVDLAALLGETTLQREDFKAPASPGADAIGRFFFVHRTRSRRGTDDLVAVEFLHATFGEYLVARLIVRELESMVRVAALADTGIRLPEPDTTMLLDALAFTPVTVRTTISETLHARLHELPMDPLSELLRRTFRAVATGELVAASTYRPVPQTPAGRQAMQSLNLLLLLLYTTGSVTASELFGTADDPTLAWRGHATLWYSQCTDDAWSTVEQSFSLAHLGSRSDRDLDVTLSSAMRHPAADVRWIARFSDPGADPPFGWGEEHIGQQRQTARLLNDRLMTYLVHALEGFDEPGFSGDDYALAGSFATLSSGRTMSAARALLNLWTASARATTPESLVTAYREAMEVGQWSIARDDRYNRHRFYCLLLRQLTADADRLPPAFAMAVRDELLSLHQFGDGLDLHDPMLRRWAPWAFPPEPEQREGRGDGGRDGTELA